MQKLNHFVSFLPGIRAILILFNSRLEYRRYIYDRKRLLKAVVIKR